MIITHQKPLADILEALKDYKKDLFSWLWRVFDVL